MTYSSEVLADSPLDFYQMETGTGTDSGSGSRTLTLSGGVTTGVTGVVGNGWSFDGSNDLATMGTYPTVTTNFTIEAWLKAPSAGGWTQDYPTVIRRDGTDIVLVRGRGSALGVSPGEVDIYLAGTSILSGVRVDDGKWHHVVLSVAGSSAKLYVDKVSVATVSTGKSSYSFGTGTAYVGGGNTAALAPTELFQGSLDNVALYNTALSATRIGAHYDAAITNVAVDVSTVTASASVNAITISDSMTFLSKSAAADNYLASSSPSVNHGTDTTLSITTNNLGVYADMAGIRFAGLPAGATLVSAKLKLYVNSVSGFSANAHTYLLAATNQVSEGSALNVATTTGGPGEVTKPAGIGWWEIDVTSTFDVLVANGFIIRLTNASTSTATMSIDSKEGTNAPVLEVAYISAPVNYTYNASTLTASADVYPATAGAGVAVDVSTLTASADALDVTVDTGSTVSVDALTASLTAYEPTVETESSPDALIDVAALTASATAYAPSVDAATSVDVDTLTASATANDATAETSSNAVIDVDAPRVIFTHLQLTGAGSENNTNPDDDDFGPIVATEAEDDYWQTVMNAGPDIWYRFNITSGTEETPRAYRYYTAGSSAYDQPLDERDDFKGRHYNTVIGLNDGPNGRKNVHFNGTARFEQAETYSNDGEITQPLGTLEFTMRTSKENQFLMRMDDKPPADFNVPVLKDVYLENGKLKFMIYTPSGNTFRLSQTVLAKANLADDKWHHIALVSDYNGYFNVYVDGKLDIRRSSPPVSFPDFVGGYLVASGLPWYAEGVPSDKWYVGDMTEVVYYHRALSQDEIYRLNDTMYGYSPVYADNARATAKANDAVVESNIKRVLTVNLGGDSTIWQKQAGSLSDTFGEYAVSFGGLNFPGTDLTHSTTQNGFQFFSVNALFQSLGNNWKDDVTDMPRLVDLNIDVNLEDYDIVTFVNVPANPSNWENLENNYSEWSTRFGGPTPVKQIEDMFRAAKQYAVDGGGLFISDPFTAQAIGMIDRFDWVDLLINDENLAVAHDNGGSHDLRGAKVSPWGYPLGKAQIANPRVPAYELQAGVDYNKLSHYYSDEHGNTWQTVRNLVDGLTDIPGRILVDGVWAWPADLGVNGDSYAIKSEQRSEGLALGDTFKIHGTSGTGEGDSGKTYGISPSLTERVNGQVATPLSHLKAGEAVTTFAPTYYDDDTAKTNPYKDHVLSAVVQPGDLLDGQVVHGRIYMNFSEGFMSYAPYMWTTPVDQIPADADMPEVYWETAESREWTYSEWRGGYAGTSNSGGGGGSGAVIGVDSNGNVIFKNGSSDNAVGLIYSHRWDVKYEERPQMAYRGLVWLGSDADADGNATIGVTTVTATAQVNEATVVAQKSTDISVETLEVLAEAWNDLDTEGEDAVVNVFTLTAVAKVEAFREVIEVPTLTATATSYDDADGILANASTLALRLPTSGLTLILEDNK